MATLDMFTFVTRNSAAYAEYMARSCRAFAGGDHSINWKCVESVGSERLPHGFDRVSSTGDARHNSMNHGLALNEACRHIESEYVVFADADIVILYPNWDAVVVNVLDRVSCFGFSYGDSGPRYRDFPVVFFFCFRASMLEDVDLDFRPRVISGQDAPVRVSLGKEEAEWMNLKPGDQIKCDTGWGLPIQIRSAGHTGEAMPRVLGGDRGHQLPFRDKAQRKKCMEKPEHMAEWHYQGELFGSHKQASRNHPLDGKWGGIWQDRISLYTKDKFGISI